MLSFTVWAIAVASLTICISLWFRDVRRIMRERESTVESAAEQLAACRRKAAGSEHDPALAKVVNRSESIYLQATELYRQTRRKAWIWLPATLMGFRSIPKEEDETR